MKKAICFIVLFGTLFLALINAQENTEETAKKERNRSFSIQMNPIIYLVDLIALSLYDDTEAYFVMLDLEFQDVVNDYINISINPQFVFDRYMNMSIGLLDNAGNYTREIYGERIQLILTLGLLYRPLGAGLKGWYIGVYPSIGWINISREGYSGQFYGYPSIDDNFTILGIGGSIGYQWVFNNGFTISLGAGGRKTWSMVSENNTGVYRDAEHLFDLPFDLTLTFRLGYSF